MVKSLEQFVSEATQAYQPASNAIQSQLNALSGQLKTTNEKINRNYAQQQAGLNRSRNAAAETASMQAAGSGGSFGGAANIANRKYYDQTFVPAQTQLQTNQANELAAARQASEDQRTNLNSQLANLQSQANQQALQQYWAAVEAERERENQRRLAAQQSAAQDSYYRYLMEAMKGGGSGGINKQNVGFEDWVKNYSGYNNNLKNNILGLIQQTGKLSQNISTNSAMGRLARNTITGNASKALSKYYNAWNQWRNS